LGTSLFISDFAIGYRTSGVASHFLAFVSHRSSAFLQVIPLVVLVTQLTAVFLLDPVLIATVSLTRAYILAGFPDQVDSY
jgi:hypothetical protein